MTARVLVIATGNSHKLAEITAVLRDFGLGTEIRGQRDYLGCPEVVEDGDTLEANAAKKAREICAWTGAPTLADDTGLEVDALDGAPGVLSARYAGPACSFADNIAKLLREMAAVPEARRAARFRCIMALAMPVAPGQPPRIQLFEGRIEGRILQSTRGTGGFGYDPVFLVPEAGCTLAEFSLARKNSLSHRAKALAAAWPTLRAELGQSV